MEVPLWNTGGQVLAWPPLPNPRPCHRVGLWESSPSISHNTTWMRLVSVCPGDSELGGFFTFQSVSFINNTQCLGPLSLHGSQINQVNTHRVGSLAGRALGHLTFPNLAEMVRMSG